MSFDQKEKNGFLLAVRVLVLGLILSQAMATLHVYFSNLDLFDKSSQIMAAGYVSIPNAKTVHLLEQFSPAFFGGIFFTLTVGSFLSLAAFSYAWIWCRFCFRKNGYLIPGLVLWAACLWLVNSHGIQMMTSAYFLVLPPGVFFATVHRMEKNPQRFNPRHLAIHVVPLILLAALGFHQVDKGLFIHFRDHVLLSNPVGIAVNDFYYRYTLYPAETFKPFDQKLIRTCTFPTMAYAVYGRKLENVLVRHDCLPVAGKRADVSLSARKNDLILRFQGKEVVKADRRSFLIDPSKTLKDYSRKTDAFGFFRAFTFFSLLIGLPITVYIFVYGFIHYVFSRLMGRHVASILASGFCLAAGIAILVMLQGGRIGVEEKDVAGLLLSDDQVERTLAIRRVIELKQDILTFPISEAHMESPFIPERYWLAVALGQSRNRKARDYLSRLAEDPQVNVRCKAFEALGKTKNKVFIPLIFDKLAKSGHVYEQLYAYKALRDLGWIQSK
ncbi:MAG: HEAT repeat domain-containing protein [Proteobacteria bacterium]|nr:HEAT repeat domain-containing protein [Pseudomonadota bacterium]MBU4469678.1 HEAT repeat domain-containing protein [Pseudomonadota bacterium]MCG2751761.1 HEAT repeat domain-containing protein [Desulfobacteraceae bacterium]